MCLFSINAGCEGNRDRLCKTMTKNISQQDTTSDRRMEMNTSRLEISYKLTLFQKKSCFNFDVHVKERSESEIFFCRGRQLENRSEKERSLWFPGAILLLIVGSLTGTEAL